MQTSFSFSGRGGKRAGAGRKKKLQGQPNHIMRPEITARTPLHITLKLRPSLGSLRSNKSLATFQHAFTRAEKLGLRVIHFSIQSNHAHLVAEASCNEDLARGMRSLTVTLAKAIQKAQKIAGAIFWGRFHLHVLKTPTEVKNALK